MVKGEGGGISQLNANGGMGGGGLGHKDRTEP